MKIKKFATRHEAVASTRSCSRYDPAVSNLLKIQEFFIKSILPIFWYWLIFFWLKVIVRAMLMDILGNTAQIEMLWYLEVPEAFNCFVMLSRDPCTLLTWDISVTLQSQIRFPLVSTYSTITSYLKILFYFLQRRFRFLAMMEYCWEGWCQRKTDL